MAELGAGVGSGYPAAVDTKQTFTNTANPLVDDSSRMDSEVLNDALDAIVKVETELGVNPSGADATVAARLNATETRSKDFTPFRRDAATGAAEWPDGSTNILRLFVVVPKDYDSGDITVKINRRGGASTNTAVMDRSVFRFRDATAFLAIDSNVAMNYTPGDTNTHVVSFTIAAANFQVDDAIRFDFRRLGADAGDTYAASVEYDGAWIEYTAKRVK